MRVVPVDTPGRENPFGEAIFPGTSDVIHDLTFAVFDDRFPNSSSQIVKHLIPTNALPFPFAAFAGTLQRVKNAIRIGNLIERRRTFRAIAPAAPRIFRISFKLLNLSRLFVDVGEQSARRLTIETSRRD